MTVIIIEDEKPAARRLARMLEALEIKPQALLHSVEEAIQWFYDNPHPDLLFLDIQLSDGLSFEIFEEVNISSAIIFTTAYDEYALKAFKLNSIDYLLKPIDEDELKQAVEQYQKQKGQLDVKAIKNLIQAETKSYKTRFSIKVGPRLKLVSTNTIECFYSENKSTYIHTNAKQNYLIDYSLEQLKDMLNPELFFRVNRAFYINVDAIKDIIAYSNSRLKIVLNSYNEAEIIVSRDRVKPFKKWID